MAPPSEPRSQTKRKSRQTTSVVATIPSSQSSEDDVDDNRVINDDRVIELESSEDEEYDGDDSDSSLESWQEEDSLSDGDDDEGPPSEDTDSSEDEMVFNPVGNVPAEWYAEEDHIGYDREGRRLLRAEGDIHGGMDTIDRLIAQAEDPNYWRTVRDELQAQNVVLSARDLEVINRIRQGQTGDSSVSMTDMYGAVVGGPDPDAALPMSSAPLAKKSFLPSKWEAKQVVKYLRAIRRGDLDIEAILDPSKRRPPRPSINYGLWDGEGEQGDENAPIHKDHMVIPAPRVAPPGHAESYNPPLEYLPTPEERAEWNALDPEERAQAWLPTQYSSLRQVPAYPHFIRDRFERCLDLYLCPRVCRIRRNIDPKTLLPQLPSPSDLKPYPSVLSLNYIGHTGRVRSISIDPFGGQYLASGAEDGTLRIWEISSGRCLRVFPVGVISDSDNKDDSGRTAVTCVCWCPSRQVRVVACAVGSSLVLVDTGLGSSEQSSFANAWWHGGGGDVASTAGGGAVVIWEGPGTFGVGADIEKPGKAVGGQGAVAVGETAVTCPTTWASLPRNLYNGGGVVVIIKHVGGGSSTGSLRHISWHSKGDYICSVISLGASSSQCLVHQLSRSSSQTPFAATAKGTKNIQRAVFHPIKPRLFVATQHHVREYDLQKQCLVRRLVPGVKHIADMDVHVGGDNLILGSYDRRIVWFDLDLSAKPYKTIRCHTEGVRAVRFHKTLPLFASASDDASVTVFHGRVYNNLMQNPLIVPLKSLKGGHKVDRAGVGVLECAWHPSLPWLFTAGADKNICCYTNI